ncbi:conserved hypothetical protein [Neospora caninum Liverpool]|uniref:Uncharacterized protein n=1 Tax=Neospora caninum (strain Liverpool) TaxID=572307 RepID=F0VG69_NEOCL|nr:conserved hypothetical protein [Neospora caninum Liverpool]CBZ52713.1 conserved hypothetical protein [Neospora caninum Liverpool]CEL66693.1 TPA: hypothetical protein BN1204_025020 [Neospora caninum Liverpool]|eukprot:XP_003882745.1 conserved hypothetical protein [Neospora caninum Liverpool]
MSPTRLLDAFPRTQTQHPAQSPLCRPSSSPSFSSPSSSSSSSHSSQALSSKVAPTQHETDGKKNFSGCAVEDASRCPAGGKETEERREENEKEKEGRRTSRVSLLAANDGNPAAEAELDEERGREEKTSVPVKVKNVREMSEEPAPSSAERRKAVSRSSDKKLLGEERHEAPREAPRREESLRLLSDKRDACRKSSPSHAPSGPPPNLPAVANGNTAKPQKQTRLPNFFFAPNPASLCVQQPSNGDLETEKDTGDEQQKAGTGPQACLPGSAKGEKTAGKTASSRSSAGSPSPFGASQSSAASPSTSCASEHGGCVAVAGPAGDESTADVLVEEALPCVSLVEEAQETEGVEGDGAGKETDQPASSGQARGAREEGHAEGAQEENRMRKDETPERAQETFACRRGAPGLCVAEPCGDNGASRDSVTSDPLSDSCAVHSPGNSAASSESLAAAAPLSFSCARVAAPHPVTTGREAPFVEEATDAQEGLTAADKKRATEEDPQEPPTQRRGENSVDPAENGEEPGRSRAALREAWSQIFKRPSKQGDLEKKNRQIPGLKKGEGEKPADESEEPGSKRKPRHSLKRENDELCGAPFWEEKRGLGDRSRLRRSAGEVLLTLAAEKRKPGDKREAGEGERDRKVEVDEGKDSSEGGPRRSRRVLARQQKRPLSDSEPVALSLSDSEERECAEGGERLKRQKVSARALLLSRRVPPATPGAKAERRGRPKRACAPAPPPRTREERFSSEQSGKKARPRNAEAEKRERQERQERQREAEGEDSRRRERQEAVMMKRRLVLQAHQRQREREEEHRVRLLVERNAAWIENLRAFEEGGLDGTCPSRLPGGRALGCLGGAAPSITTTRESQGEDSRVSREHEPPTDDLNAREDSSGRQQPHRRARLKRRRLSSEEEGDPETVTKSRLCEGDGSPGEMENAIRGVSPTLEAAFSEASGTRSSNLQPLRAAPPRGLEWRDVRARLLDLCGLESFLSRDVFFFVTSGPFAIYTRNGILKILEKTGLPVTTSLRRATCILTNDAGYWPQAETPPQERPSFPSSSFPSSFPSSSSFLSSSLSPPAECIEQKSEEGPASEGPSAPSAGASEAEVGPAAVGGAETTHLDAVRKRAVLSPGAPLAPASVSRFSSLALSALFDGPRVATESVLMRAMGLSVEEAAQRFNPVNDKSGVLVQDVVRACLRLYARHQHAPEGACAKARGGAKSEATQDAETPDRAAPMAVVEDGADFEEGHAAEAKLLEGEEREAKEENEGGKEDRNSKKGTTVRADAATPASSKEESLTVHTETAPEAPREEERVAKLARETEGKEIEKERRELECQLPGNAGVLKTPCILWLGHLTEMWDRAFEACSLSELAGNNDAVLELHALLKATLERGPSLSGKSADLESLASDAEAAPEKPLSLLSRKKPERGSGCGGSRASGRRREAQARREKEERPRVILVSMPPGCGGDRLIDLLCYACGHQAVREQKLREEKRIDGLFHSMAMVSAQARALKHQETKTAPSPADAVVLVEDEASPPSRPPGSARPTVCSHLRVKPPGETTPKPPSKPGDFPPEVKESGRRKPLSVSPSGGARGTQPDSDRPEVSLPLPRLSVYDWWSLSRADQKRLLQRRPRKQGTERGEEKHSPPVLCIARWREGEDEQAARDAVNASIDEAISGTVTGGRGRRGGASSDEEEGLRDAEALRRGIHLVALRPPPREALVQRVLAIATAAIGAPVDRALVELLFASSGDGHQGPGAGEAVPLSGILHTLHLVTRTHMNSRLLHAAYHYETQRQLDAQHRELDACASSEGAYQSPKDPLSPPSTRGSERSFTLPAASWYDAEPDYCTKDDHGDARGGSSNGDTTACSTQARLSSIIQNFVLPPLERPLPLPFALAEAPLLAFWRLQQAQPMSLFLQLFGSRNALAADSLAAPMHAFDLLHEKFAHSQRAAFSRRRAPDETLAEVADRHGSVETLLDAFNVCARAVKIENECSDCLVLDAQDGGPAGGKASQSGGGKSPSENDFAARYGGGSPGSSDATKDVLKENVETAPLRGLPLRIGAHLPETTAHFLGELILGGVALLQHGPEGAYEPPPLGCSLDALQRQFVTERMIQQEKLQTRRRLEKVGEGSLKVLDWRRAVEEAGTVINFEAPEPAPTSSIQSDPGETEEYERDVPGRTGFSQGCGKCGGPSAQECYSVDGSGAVEGFSDSEESDSWMEDDVNMFEIMSASTMLRSTEQIRQTFLAEGRMLEKVASSRSKGGKRVKGIKKKTSAFPDDAKFAKVVSNLGSVRRSTHFL